MATTEITARLKLAADQFSADYKRKFGDMERQAESFNSKMKSGLGSLKGLAIGAFAGFGISEIAQAATKALDYASSLGEVSQQLGVNTRDLQLYRFAATQAGISQEEMDKSLAKLTVTIGKASDGGKAQAAAFKSLGIDIHGANGRLKTAGDVIPEISDALAKIPDPAKRAAAEVLLFGKTGQKLETLLAGGAKGIKAITDEAERLGIVLSDKEIQSADEAADKISKLKFAFEMKMSKTVAENAEQISNFADSLLKLAVAAPKALAEINRLGKPIADLFNAIPAAGYRLGVNMGLRERDPETEKLTERLHGFGLGSGNAGSRPRKVAPRELNRPSMLRPGVQLPAYMPPQAEVPALLMRRNLVSDTSDAAWAFAEQATRTALSAPDRLGTRKRPSEEDVENAKRLTVALKEANSEATDLARLTSLRAAGHEREADIEEELLSIRTRYPELIGRTTGAVAATLKIDEKAAGVLLGQLDTLENMARARVNGEHDAQAAEDARRANKEAEEAARRAQEDFARDQARQQEESVRSLADGFERAFDSGGKSIWKDFEAQGKRALAELAAQWVLGMVSGQQQGFGGILAQINGSGGGAGGFLQAIGGLFGGGNSDQLGASINAVAAANARGMGGGIGGAAAAAPGGGIGAGITTAAQSAGEAIPLLGASMAITSMVSDIFGIKNHGGGIFGVLGNLAINAFTPTKKGSATLGFDQYGGLGVTSTGGNSGKRKEASSLAVGGVGDTLARIAEQLGATLGGTPSVSLGMRKDSYRVDTTGKGRTKGRGVLDFGKDQEAAIRAAISDALKDGVVQGISDASKRILQSGQELEKAIEKAAMIEDIPRQLRARMDPVGAALDELNKRWDKTVAALKEGGASAAQMADAQKLYRLELDDTKASTAEASANLKAFQDSLKFGSSSPLSLRDQEAAAQAALQPFLDKIDRGDRIDQGKYAELAQAYLDVERQISGSTGGFFDKFGKIQDYTGRAIATIDNAVPIRTASDPFAEKTSANTLATADILASHSVQLSDLNASMARLVQIATADSGGFIGGGRGFATRPTVKAA